MFNHATPGPRINADDVTPSHGLFLTCRGEKYVQYYTMYIHIVDRTMCEVFKCKKSLSWGVGRNANLTPLWSHVENQRHRFPQATSLTPSPSQSPFSSPHFTLDDRVLLRVKFI